MDSYDLEEELFAKWRQRHPDLIRDGIVSKPSYGQSDPKIVFILKEPHDFKAGEDILWLLGQAGGDTSTWGRIAQWTHGIRNLEQNIQWASVPGASDISFRKAYLPTIGAMNLKKTQGGSSSKDQAIKKFALDEAEAELLRKQLSLYRDADLFVCCGRVVYEVVCKLIPDYFVTEKCTRNGVTYAQAPRWPLLINYVHPASHVWSNMLFYTLVDAVRELRGEFPLKPASE